MGIAFGLLGLSTFAAMFGMGYCLTSKKQILEKNATLEAKIKTLEEEKAK